MAQQEITGVQVQMAASAGVQLLAIKDLPVPMEIAKTGALALLEGLLGALARGEVVITQAPKPEEVPAPDTPPPGLERIGGGKAD